MKSVFFLLFAGLFASQVNASETVGGDADLQRILEESHQANGPTRVPFTLHTGKGQLETKMADLLASQITEHEYVASVTGPENCKMPADRHNPKEGECSVHMATMQEGWSLVKVDDACYRSELVLERWESMDVMGRKIELPVAQETMSSVPCPGKG